MKNLSKIAVLLFILFAVTISCSKSEELQIKNNYSQGIYLMDIETAEKSTADELEKLKDEASIDYIDANGGTYSYKGSGYNTDDSELDKYKADDKFTFCFVTDSALKKAKANKTKVEYKTVSQDFEMKNITGITITVNDSNGEPGFEFALTSKTGL